MKSNDRYICIYGASSNDIPQKYIDATYSMSKQLAAEGWNVINGAGACGVMRAATDGFVAMGQKAMGIIPQFMIDNGWLYEGVTEVVATTDMHTRKELMAQRSQCAIAMPGGCGTLEELLEIITWRQLGLYNKPLIIMNIDGFFDDLIAMLNKCISENFMKPSHSQLWVAISNVADVVNYINNYDEDKIVKFESKQ